MLRVWLHLLALLASAAATVAAGLDPVALRTEYLVNPLGLDEPRPRLSWQVESPNRGAVQTAYQILVASSAAKLETNEGDLWDSGKVTSGQTVNVAYAGPALGSRQTCHWKVKVWDQANAESAWSAAAHWSMGLLGAEDWSAQWISFRDETPVHADRTRLELPSARHYRREFGAPKPVARATLYASALGLVEFHLNGQRIGDAWFEPGWSDYKRRAYYRTHDVTKLVSQGANCVGAVVADGWYAGYVGYGLLVGYGPNKAGRNFYGKTPALLAQLELEYADGTREIIGSDTRWEVSGDGPIREADLIMGEAYDARLDRPTWCQPAHLRRDESNSTPPWRWSPAIRAEENGSVRAVFSDPLGDREVELGFQRPPRLQAYAAPPIRATAELPARQITEPKPGAYIFDLGQNFAGVVRLRLEAPAGTRVTLRHGEMLHPDGRLMTENLRRARATDFYTARGDADGETWTPRFTYHGFRYVEVSGLPARPGLESVTGLVLHNDTPWVGTFACSDEVLTRFWLNTRWTQAANFVELPTDCPQRDERLGWMGDAQVYIRAASYNADVAAFFTKWLDDVEEAQRDFGAYPDYCPYPMAHGTPYKTFGTAWTDAGIICPWTIWQVYGDTRVIDRHWASMVRFMDFRAATTTPEGLGTSIGNSWGDWLNLGETTPIEYIDTCYHALDCRLMAEMAEATNRGLEAKGYRRRFAAVQAAFNKEYVRPDGALKIATQTAHVLALWVGLLPDKVVGQAAGELAARIARNEYRMATGFLGTKPLLPVLTAHGHHDLAARLFQSRKFPSWGYEVINGATTVWERWDSYTQEHGFNGQSGDQNASMNSFSHYSFGAVTEWMFRGLAGIDTDGPGFRRLTLRPAPPSPGSNPDVAPVNWVKAEYGSVQGRISSRWKRENDRFELDLELPANTSATLHLPSKGADTATEGGRPVAQAESVKILRQEGDRTVLAVGSGRYLFRSLLER